MAELRVRVDDLLQPGIRAWRGALESFAAENQLSWDRHTATASGPVGPDDGLPDGIVRIFLEQPKGSIYPRMVAELRATVDDSADLAALRSAAAGPLREILEATIVEVMGLGMLAFLEGFAGVDGPGE